MLLGKKEDNEKFILLACWEITFIAIDWAAWCEAPQPQHWLTHSLTFRGDVLKTALFPWHNVCRSTASAPPPPKKKNKTHTSPVSSILLSAWESAGPHNHCSHIVSRLWHKGVQFRICTRAQRVFQTVHPLTFFSSPDLFPLLAGDCTAPGITSTCICLCPTCYEPSVFLLKTWCSTPVRPWRTWNGLRWRISSLSQKLHQPAKHSLWVLALSFSLQQLMNRHRVL